MRFNTVLWWIKRDFRLDDNAALAAATITSREVIPCFFFDRLLFSSEDSSETHLAIQLQALSALTEEIEQFAASVLKMQSDTIPGLHVIYETLSFDAIFMNATAETAVERLRTQKVKAWCRERGILFKEVANGLSLEAKPGDLGWKEQVFSAPQPRVSSISQFPVTRTKIQSLSTKAGFKAEDSREPLVRQVVSECEAQRTLASFLSERGESYCTGINSPQAAAYVGSRLSPHLAWGTISLQRVYRATESRILELKEDGNTSGMWLRSLKSFRSRLHWHYQLTKRFSESPEMEFAPLVPYYEALPFSSNKFFLTAWLLGQTGVPMVDACMRCLRDTGFLNFRMRAMVVSYACHILHIPWSDIVHPLASRLCDYNPPIHINQVQIQAGIASLGTVRIYNPSREMLEHDPELHFVRRWVPELRERSTSEIRYSDSRTISGYSQTLVDFNYQSEVTRAAFRAIRKQVTASGFSDISDKETPTIQDTENDKIVVH